MRTNRDAEDASHIQLFGTGAVRELEWKLARLYNMKHALCVSNCTTGLLAVGLALNLQNQEVIVPPLVYGASLSGLLLLGNKLKFCDVDPVTLTLDPESVRRAIGPQTKAVLGVDIFGVPCDSVRLRKVADERGLHYISDCAQSLGATRDSSPSGVAADAIVVSFTSGKTIFAGEGGAIITNNTNIYERLLWLTQHPHRQRKELGLHLYNEVNLNGRIHPLSAIWANAVFEDSLNRLHEWQRTCLRLINALNEVGMTETINFEEMQIEPTYFRITASPATQNDIQILSNELQARGFEISIYPAFLAPIYLNGTFRAQFEDRVSGSAFCPIAEEQAKRRLTIRLHQ
jgi:perosamine synthetase